MTISLTSSSPLQKKSQSASYKQSTDRIGIQLKQLLSDGLIRKMYGLQILAHMHF